MIGTERENRRRAVVVERRPEFADILPDDEPYVAEGVGDPAGKPGFSQKRGFSPQASPEEVEIRTAERVDRAFDLLVLQSGVALSRDTVLALVVGAALVVGGLFFVLQEHLLAAGLGLILGAGAPLGILMVLRARRQRAILRQLPDAVDLLGRGVRAGRSIEQSLKLAADDVAAPLGDELRCVVGRLDMGLALADALSDLPRRTGVTSARILVTALAVHQQTGGDLLLVLDRLSRTVRERIVLAGKVRAATAASRATAVLMLVLAPAALVFFMLRDPGYLDTLWSAPAGRAMLVAAVALDLIGSLWVLRVVRRSAAS